MTMENTSIVKANTSIIQSVDDLSRIGKMMAVSGYFTDARDAAQASVKIMAGMEMGFGAFASMTGIYIIGGKPSVGANLMASAVKSNPKYDYRVKEISGTVCTIEFYEINGVKRESIGTSTFTLEEAKKAGVKNLDKYARNMLFARAMSNGIRWFCPDVFAGNPTYTPEELGASVDDEGNVTELPVKTTQNAPEQPAVIEAEVTPVTVPTAQETPAEAQKKPEFDEHEFLRGWRHRTDLPAVTLRNAQVIENSQGKAYGTLETRQLYHMMNALQKRINATEVEMDKAPLFQKMGAINTILTARASALEQLETAADPFVKPAE